MLKCWTLHYSYRQFISDCLDSLSESDFLRLQDSYRKFFYKLLLLNLDLLLDALLPFYSSTGRPVLFQSEIFRSLLLMIDCGFISKLLFSFTNILALLNTSNLRVT